MPNAPLDNTQLRTLTAILRHGGFEAAAQSLGVTQSAVSQRLRALEDRMGTTLVVRGTPCTATDAGQRLFAHAEAVALLEAALARDLGNVGPAPAVRIAVNADSLATWFVPALTALDGAPFEIIIDDQDHSADLLRRGEVVAAVTSDGRPVQGCDTEALGALRYVATASPSFRARWFNDGVTAETLSRAPMLVYNEKDQLQRRWAERAGGSRHLAPICRLPSSTAFVEAARLGLGWGMNPEPLVRAALRDGTLVPLAPELPLDTPLYWQAGRILRPALAPLTGAVRAAARRQLRVLT